MPLQWAWCPRDAVVAKGDQAMFASLLRRSSKEFEDAVWRPGLFVHPSHALREVLAALARCKKAPDARFVPNTDLRTLLTRLFTWRTQEPVEYADRGATEAVGYRLWMEAKQMLQNHSGLPYADHADPPAPPTVLPGAAGPYVTLGTTVAGTYVPSPDSEPSSEICHHFSYRWLVANGRMPPDPGDPTMQSLPDSFRMRRILFPLPMNRYPPVKMGAFLMVRPGDLIGFFGLDGGEGFLQHSLIAVSSGYWFGANNLGTFGTTTGRSGVQVFPNSPQWQMRASVGFWRAHRIADVCAVRFRRFAPTGH